MDLYNSFHLAISLLHILLISRLKIHLRNFSRQAIPFYLILKFCFIQNPLRKFVPIQHMCTLLFRGINHQQNLLRKHFHRTLIFLCLFFNHLRNLQYTLFCYSSIIQLLFRDIHHLATLLHT